MSYKLNHIILALFCLTGLQSCDITNVDKCKEPEAKQKAYIDSVNAQHKDKLTLIPYLCNDMIIVMFSSDYDAVLTDSLKNSYSRAFREVDLIIYDKNGMLVTGDEGSM